MFLPFNKLSFHEHKIDDITTQLQIIFAIRKDFNFY